MTEDKLEKQADEARAARGLTRRDVEGDTRISSKYIKALEAGELDLLPAPVYARAFLRTYAQYLGLNAPEMVQQLPGARPEPVLPALPDVGRDAVTPRLSASWTVAGVVVVVLFAAGLALFWSRAGRAAAATALPPLAPTCTAGPRGAVRQGAGPGSGKGFDRPISNRPVGRAPRAGKLNTSRSSGCPPVPSSGTKSTMGVSRMSTSMLCVMVM